jgi:hypothetical protein
VNAAFVVVFFGKGYLPLHTAAVETERGAALISGKSGIGKSTAAALLAASGRRLLGDDLCLVDVSASPRPNVSPAYDSISITDRVRETILTALPSAEILPPARGTKHLFRLGERFCDAPLPAWRFVSIEISNDSRAHLRPMAGAAKLQSILNAVHYQYPVFRYYLAGLAAKRVATLANNVSAASLFRPYRRELGEDYLDLLTSAIDDDI